MKKPLLRANGWVAALQTRPKTCLEEGTERLAFKGLRTKRDRLPKLCASSLAAWCRVIDPWLFPAPQRPKLGQTHVCTFWDTRSGWEAPASATIDLLSPTLPAKPERTDPPYRLTGSRQASWKEIAPLPGSGDAKQRADWGQSPRIAGCPVAAGIRRFLLGSENCNSLMGGSPGPGRRVHLTDA